MIYSDLYLKKNNTLTIVISLLIVAFVGVVFVNSFLKLAPQSKASIQVADRVEVVNLSPMEASIFWQTDKAETGWVAYGDLPGLENKIVLDEKDGQTKGSYITHLVKLRDLTPGHKYYYKMISDNNRVIAMPDGSPFSFSTPQNNTQNTSVIYGIILQPNSSPLTNANVIFSLVGKDIYPFFAETKSDGSWLVSINQIYAKDSAKNSSLSKKERAKIEVITSDGQKTTVTLYINNPQQTQTLPTFVFGKDRDYPDNNVLSASTNMTKTNNDQIEISYPQEGALIPGTIPLIKGLGIPNTLIEVTVNSKKTYAAKVTSDSNGNWSYLLPESLELGPHTVTIKTVDKNGNSVLIVRHFTMIAQEGNEGRVLGTATGEPTITLTNTPAPTYPVATNVPSTTSGLITATPGLLKSGGNVSGAIFGGLGLIIIGGGVLLVF